VTWLAVAFLGGVGVSLRYLLTHIFAGNYSFPLAVLVANVVGSILIGAGYTWSQQAGTSQSMWVIAVSLGLLGGLTTFSSFSLETVRLLQSGYMAMAAANLVANNLFCLLGCYIGMRLAGLLGTH